MPARGEGPSHAGLTAKKPSGFSFGRSSNTARPLVTRLRTSTPSSGSWPRRLRAGADHGITSAGHLSGARSRGRRARAVRGVAVRTRFESGVATLLSASGLDKRRQSLARGVCLRHGFRGGEAAAKRQATLAPTYPRITCPQRSTWPRWWSTDLGRRERPRSRLDRHDLGSDDPSGMGGWQR